jgi:hypothetical protein
MKKKGDENVDENVSSKNILINLQTSTSVSTPNTEVTLTEFLGSINCPHEEVILPRNSNLTQSQAENCIASFASQQKLSINEAKVAIAILFQSGGTAKSCDGNLSINIFGQNIKLAYVRKALITAKCKGSERKLARYIATEISEISKKFEIPGNLAKKITRLISDRKFTLEESVWLSDFQVDNKDCPEILRKFISDSFEKKTDNPNKKTSTSTKPGKKTGK